LYLLGGYLNEYLYIKPRVSKPRLSREEVVIRRLPNYKKVNLYEILKKAVFSIFLGHQTTKNTSLMGRKVTQDSRPVVITAGALG
jgi:hypothetical protein